MEGIHECVNNHITTDIINILFGDSKPLAMFKRKKKKKTRMLAGNKNTTETKAT